MAENKEMTKEELRKWMNTYRDRFIEVSNKLTEIHKIVETEEVKKGKDENEEKEPL